MKQKLALNSLLILAGMVCGLAACKPASHNDTETTLEGSGNQRVAERYKAYTKARESGQLRGCSSGGSAQRRVMLTGFGPFQSDGHNISGTVVASLAAGDFWPKENGIARQQTPPSRAPSSDAASGHGVTATQRTLKYNGMELEVCFLLLDVQWDLAAAYIIAEAQRFSPDLIVMSGRGPSENDARLEAGAINDATHLSGYERDGRSSSGNNIPRGANLLPLGNGVERTIALSWKNGRLAKKGTNALSNLNKFNRTSFRFLPATGADPENNYVCNNVSFLVAHAVKGVALPLADGKLTLHPRFNKSPAVGFFHYPSTSAVNTKQVWSWGHVLMSLTEAHFLRD